MSVISASNALKATKNASMHDSWTVEAVLPACVSAIDEIIRNHTKKGVFDTEYEDGR